MPRLTLLAGLSLAVALALAGPGATQSAGDQLTGSGKIAFVDFPEPGSVGVEQIIISAHSGPAGEDPRGHNTLHSPFLEEKNTAKARVICLRVTGTRAIAGAEFSKPIRYLGVMIRHVNLAVQDNGSDDMAAGFAFIDRPRPPDFSPCDVQPPELFQVVQGNYEVKDRS